MKPNLDRRRAAIGLAASLVSLAAAGRLAAEASDVPHFRSGRFQFTLLEPRKTLPSVVLFPLHGQPIDLSSLRGRPILLNFWATWCEACRTELPMLDRLQAGLRASGVQIIAVSVDRDGRATVERFISAHQIKNLKVCLDPNGYVAFHDTENKRNSPFALYGMPITYAVATSGWIVGYMPGAADWSSAPAKQLLEFLDRS